MIPRATSRPPLPDQGAVRDIHRLTALHALVATRGGGAMVVVSRRAGSRRSGRTAQRVAKAWDQMLADAEARHVAFWRAYDAERAAV